MEMLIFCDIDGTVADNTHRQHLLGDVGSGKKLDWGAFLNPDAVFLDTPIPRAKENLHHFMWPNYSVIFLTGRSEGLRGVTNRWLIQHMGIETSPSTLVMRPDGEFSKVTEFKSKILVEHRIANPTSHFMYIDDDPYMWGIARKYGTVLKAPMCWDVMNPDSPTLAEETYWRK